MKNKTLFLMVATALLIGFVSTVIYMKYQQYKEPIRLEQAVFVENLKTQKSCEEYGHSWKQVGIAQVFTCVEEYSDAGESCDASTDCQGRCIQRDIDGPATCEQSSNVFGCRNSVENIAAGEGILCID